MIGWSGNLFTVAYGIFVKSESKSLFSVNECNASIMKMGGMDVTPGGIGFNTTRTRS